MCLKAKKQKHTLHILQVMHLRLDEQLEFICRINLSETEMMHAQSSSMSVWFSVNSHLKVKFPTLISYISLNLLSVCSGVYAETWKIGNMDAFSLLSLSQLLINHFPSMCLSFCCLGNMC